MDVYALLGEVKNGGVSIEQAAEKLKQLPYEDLGFARVDHHRKLRTGCAEVIFCQGKTAEQVAVIFSRLAEAGSNVLATRANEEQYQEVKKRIPRAVFHETAKTITLIVENVQKGLVAVCTGGTADIPVAEEAAITAEIFGARVERIYDVGVSGVHRLLHKIPQINEANAIVAVAGMEGALPSVIAGLVDKPVIATPTSVGYGANFGGLSALLTMLNSCAAGVSAVNIDNGFGAGYMAAQINRIVTQTEKNTAE